MQNKVITKIHTHTLAQDAGGWMGSMAHACFNALASRRQENFICIYIQTTQLPRTHLYIILSVLFELFVWPRVS